MVLRNIISTGSIQSSLICFKQNDLAHGMRAVKQTKIPVTLLVFKHACFDFYSTVCSNGFELGLRFELELELWSRFEVRVWFKLGH